MATFDYFVGPLCCPACGHISRDARTNMQTKMTRHPSLRELATGDSLDVDWSAVSSAGYLKISEPVSPDTVNILETWDCPACGKSYNWATIGVVRGKIEFVEPVALSADIIRAANYITEDCRFLLNTPTKADLMVNTLIQQLETSSP